jgi:microcystin-dependent protein
VAAASVTNTFTGATAAVASQVNRNFTDLVDFANDSTVHRDGSKPFTGQVSMGSFKIANVAAGTAANDAVNFDQLGNALPAGFIGMYGNAVAPSAWLLCNGAAYSRAAYTALFAAIGTSYGVGDGATTFNVPNMNAKFPYGGTPGSTGGSNDAVNISHSHTMGDHNHAQDPHSHTMGEHAHVTDINHDHGVHTTGGNSVNHSHTAGANVVAAFGTGTLGFGTNVIGSPLNYVSGTDLVGNQTVSHIHTFDVPALGVTNRASTLVDPGDTAPKTATNILVDPGDTNPAGVSGTNLNRPAFVGVTFIIKSGL